MDMPSATLEGGSRTSWASLPADCMSILINRTGVPRPEVGKLRLVCRAWHTSVDATVEALEPRCADYDQFGLLPLRYPLLTSLDVRKFDFRLFDHRVLFRDSLALMQPAVTNLAQMPSLSELTLSSVRQLKVQPHRKDLAPTAQHALPTFVFFQPHALRLVTRLVLSHTCLSRFPEELMVLTGLQSLSLLHCWLPDLGDAISCLTGLTELDVTGNRLRALPDAVCCLTSLVTLVAASNILTALPPGLWNLAALQQLRLHNNHLAEVPAAALARLSTLTMLDLSHNYLLGFRQWGEVCSLGSLQHLLVHNVSDVRHSLALPVEIGGLSSLRHLEFSNNFLALSPPGLSLLGDLTSLTSLHMAELKLEVLPEAITKLRGLEVLDVRKNCLASLPAWLSSMRLLRELQADHNPLDVLSPCLPSSLTFLGLGGVAPLLLPAALLQMPRLRLVRVGEQVLTPAAAKQWLELWEPCVQHISSHDGTCAAAAGAV